MHFKGTFCCLCLLFQKQLFIISSCFKVSLYSDIFMVAASFDPECSRLSYTCYIYNLFNIINSEGKY